MKQSRKVEVFSHNRLIGTSELEVTEESMGILFGSFVPTAHYFDIRDTIWKFHHSEDEENFLNLKNLRLNAQLDCGCFLYPLGGFLIFDMEDLPEKEIQFEAAGVFRHIVIDCFLNSPPTLKLSSPWEPVKIEQKISFEDELSRELSPDHPLAEYEYSAVASSTDSDDVLYAIHKPGDDVYDYAIVHLTWSSKQESDTAYPRVKFYKEFEEIEVV
ncbi:hypothetical protein LVD15_07825 [Fulvivirga maritima]|uniref:hypothetical protein n=1 Tax=Fulvivirga maritima TaxID=2904247 RepID=UPI001F26783D|nr:hypothetical protein [Fulvivirga maritima]UII28326.1 hypothetical protein LVD15_07825 [Fulvivirga maritima]